MGTESSGEKEERTLVAPGSDGVDQGLVHGPVRSSEEQGFDTDDLQERSFELASEERY